MPNHFAYRQTARVPAAGVGVIDVEVVRVAGSLLSGHPASCSTLYYMTTLTVRINEELDADLREIAARTGKGKSEFVREALRRQLAIARFEDLRQRLAPFAEARGWLTDEDVFEAIS